MLDPAVMNEADEPNEPDEPKPVINATATDSAGKGRGEGGGGEEGKNARRTLKIWHIEATAYHAQPTSEMCECREVYTSTLV